MRAETKKYKLPLYMYELKLRNTDFLVNCQLYYVGCIGLSWMSLGLPLKFFCYDFDYFDVSLNSIEC